MILKSTSNFSFPWSFEQDFCSRIFSKDDSFFVGNLLFKHESNCKKYVASLKSILPKSWNELPPSDGYYVTTNSEIKCGRINNTDFIANNMNQNVCQTKKQALSQIAFAKLTQLASNMNGDCEADWSNFNNNTKFMIIRNGCSLVISSVNYTYSPICFKSAELRDFSFEHHLDLWKQYYQLD